MLAAVPTTLAQGASQGARSLDFFIGHWEVDVVQTYPNGQKVPSKARTHAYWVLDGHAMQDDWRALDARGAVVFRGMSFRTYVQQLDAWAIQWVMANTPGYTNLHVVWRDGELHGEGHGRDGGGAFLERFRYHDISDTRYAFTMERSYDAGTTWRQMTTFQAHKVDG